MAESSTFIPAPTGVPAMLPSEGGIPSTPPHTDSDHTEGNPLFRALPSEAPRSPVQQAPSPALADDIRAAREQSSSLPGEYDADGEFEIDVAIHPSSNIFRDLDGVNAKRKRSLDHTGNSYSAKVSATEVLQEAGHAEGNHNGAVETPGEVTDGAFEIPEIGHPHANAGESGHEGPQGGGYVDGMEDGNEDHGPPSEPSVKVEEGSSGRESRVSPAPTDAGHQLGGGSDVMNVVGRRSHFCSPLALDANVFCSVCAGAESNVEDRIVICDGCDAPYHQMCHTPLPIPNDIADTYSAYWFCHQCEGTDTARRMVENVVPVVDAHWSFAPPFDPTKPVGRPNKPRRADIPRLKEPGWVAPVIPSDIRRCLTCLTPLQENRLDAPEMDVAGSGMGLEGQQGSVLKMPETTSDVVKILLRKTCSSCSRGFQNMYASLQRCPHNVLSVVLLQVALRYPETARYLGQNPQDLKPSDMLAFSARPRSVVAPAVLLDETNSQSTRISTCGPGATGEPLGTPRVRSRSGSTPTSPAVGSGAGSISGISRQTRPRMTSALGSYEDMITLAVGEMRDRTGSKPKNIFQWMADNIPDLPEHFRPSASQSLKKAVDRGRLIRGPNGLYTVNTNWVAPEDGRKRRKRVLIAKEEATKAVVAAARAAAAKATSATPRDKTKARAKEDSVAAETPSSSEQLPGTAPTPRYRVPPPDTATPDTKPVTWPAPAGMQHPIPHQSWSGPPVGYGGHAHDPNMYHAPGHMQDRQPSHPHPYQHQPHPHHLDHRFDPSQQHAHPQAHHHPSQQQHQHPDANETAALSAGHVSQQQYVQAQHQHQPPNPFGGPGTHGSRSSYYPNGFSLSELIAPNIRSMESQQQRQGSQVSNPATPGTQQARASPSHQQPQPQQEQHHIPKQHLEASQQQQQQQTQHIHPQQQAQHHHNQPSLQQQQSQQPSPRLPPHYYDRHVHPPYPGAGYPQHHEFALPVTVQAPPGVDSRTPIRDPNAPEAASGPATAAQQQQNVGNARPSGVYGMDMFQHERQ
ncbi:uncharacterized protein EV422DRAFT_56076 [Fimicolochytrium jonesii]|uniref:uncharacterized protein n=1 Tax=Fimicolochytrium jonesii TaxID=1396493 RepID=UPI0022FEB148|nr:uncharacterized protein EV422DRAFT_56076 [Fimicolochytrium jonesii]KAI8821154.1 hypothetical protein EV422DRAFT_56076 [Fimicolochytrium jonesii]